MASRVTVVFTIVLSLSVLSQSQAQARVSFERPQNLPTQWNPSNDFPDSDSKSTIALPTDAIQSYSEEIPNDRLVGDSEPKELLPIVESEPMDLPDSDSINGARITTPLSVGFAVPDSDSVELLPYDDSFRPINHHFHHMPLKRNHPFHFRFPVRCRHHHRFGKPMGPRFSYGREIPYGNDMIMSDETNFDLKPRFHHGDVMRHVVPGMMMHPRRPVWDNNVWRQEDKMKRHHREEEQEEHMEDEEMKREEKEDVKEEGGFMFLKNFRKFLNDLKP